jgi:tetratricopeptide (TPR) repeat protein
VQPAANAASAPAAPAAPAVPLPLTSLLPPELSASKEKPSAPTPVVPVAASIPATPALPVAAAAPVPATASTPRETIKVTTGNNAPAISPVLIDAYAALSAGKLESSQQLYNQLLKSDPRSIDAHLGLADIASQQGDRDAASRHYVKVLELDPRNPLAQAGLIGLLGRADPQAAETRVKQLITRDPGAAYLHFTLGNTYVDQARWPDAQQAFFQAHHLQPDNPDYAYNLAVALEHIGQPKSALDFYRRAVLLAAAKGHANFSPTAAQERVTKLEKVVQ